VLVDELVARLRALGATRVVEAEGITERVAFQLPKALSGTAR
jgi:hypothetical protein